MDLAFLLGGLTASLIRGYPETRLIRLLLKKLSLTNIQHVWCAFGITLLINTTYLLIATSVDLFSILFFEIVGIGILCFVDSQRENTESRTMKIMNNIFVRILLIILTFILALIFSFGILQALEIDPFYLLSPVFALIYTFFAYRRKRVYRR